MKKFLSLVAGLSLAASASAAGPWDFTATPEPGTVTELSEIKVTFPNLNEIEINNNDDITLSYNGNPVVAKSNAPYGVNYFTVKLNEPTTLAGKYVLTVNTGAIAGYGNLNADGDFELMEDNEAFTIEYTIGGGETPDVNKFEYTVTPEPGEVESLDKVILTFTYSEWASVKIVNDKKSDITMTLNGEPVACNASKPLGRPGTRIQVSNPSDDKTIPGEYVITIPAGTIQADVAGFNPDKSATNPEPIILTYTIKGGETPDPGTDPDDPGTVTGTWGYTTTPASGIVEELSEIKVTFPNLESIDVNDESLITLTCNGNPIETNSAGYDVNYFIIKLKEPAKTAGKYVVSIPAGALTGYKDLTDDGYAFIEDNEAFTIEYTIEGEAPALLDFTMTADPADKSALKKLEKVVVTFPNLDSVTVGEDWPAILYDNSPLTIKDYTTTVDKNVVTITLTEEATAMLVGPANVQIAFPAGEVTGKKGEETGTNDEDLYIGYTLIGGVQYDLDNLELARTTKPNDKGEISAEKQLNSFFFSYNLGNLKVSTGSESNVTIKQIDGDYEVSGHLKRSPSTGDITYFSVDFNNEPTYNGKYVITVAQGAFGDEEWAADPETGHSNPEITINFTLIDGRDIDLNTVVATVAPEAGTYDSFDKIATITVSFDEEMTPVEGAGATLVAEDGSIQYNKAAEFTKSDNGFTVTFPAPENASNKEAYAFNVLPGQFKNAEGLGNAEINVIYTVDKKSGVAGIEIDSEEAEVYTLDGNRVTGKTLAPGIYIINGAKVLVK